MITEYQLQHKPTAQAVWICRHGERIDQVDPTWRQRNGHDPHLSDKGIRQAIATGTRLQGEGIQRVFASPFLRTVETAHHIADVLDLPVHIEQGLTEWLNPRWFAQMPSVLSPADVSQRFPRVEPDYASLVLSHYPETGDQAFARAGRAARLLAERTKDNLLLVGHGHSVQGMAWGLLRARPTVHAEMCALIKLGRQGTVWRLQLDGDTSHLP